MVEVMQRLGLSANDLKPLSRCRYCNAPLAPLDRNLVQGRVPEHVFLHHRWFYECPRCHRVYWPGSHIKGISGTLRDQLAQIEGMADDHTK